MAGATLPNHAARSASTRPTVAANATCVPTAVASSAITTFSTFISTTVPVVTPAANPPAQPWHQHDRVCHLSDGGRRVGWGRTPTTAANAAGINTHRGPI